MAIESGDLAGMVATVSVMAVPIVAMLLAHQRKMAQIIHGSQQTQSQNVVQHEQLTSEVRDLKQMVYQQAIALDNLTTEVKRVGSPPGQAQQLSVRLGEDRTGT